ncbi:unnamed protein product [Allacma fusca]|uniref:Uncharacterized protein n=1 Tax=Allacma fusca TaxID=39272 RepID=A0A8J2KQQ2_9HEXA|nr:unnamed protein product [Allacma fusca]
MHKGALESGRYDRIVDFSPSEESLPDIWMKSDGGIFRGCKFAKRAKRLSCCYGTGCNHFRMTNLYRKG